MQTSTTIKAAMIAKAQFFTVSELKAEITKLNDNFTDESGCVMSVLLDVLGDRILTKEFVDFCDSL